MPDNDARLTDLEVRYTYLERTVRELDQVVVELRAELERLQRQTKELGATLRNTQDSAPANEKPPHY
jgi:SlyX protein